MKLNPVRAIVPETASVVIGPVPLAVVAAGTVLVSDVCPLPLYVIVEFHCAYKVVSPDGTNVVAPTAYVVPLPFAAVFQPPKVKLVLTSEPVFEARVSVPPVIETVLLFGVVPPVAEFASYVMT